jgi:hypothetical protein
MQETTEEAEASISTENEREEDPNLNGTFAVRRKAAKRTLPWDLASRELYLAEDIPATKKQRLEVPFSASSTDEAAVNISLPDTAVSLPADADANHADADADPVKGTQAAGYWTPEEDAKLNSAVTSTYKKKCNKEYRTDWVAVAALVPGRSQKQCCNRWQNVDPNIDRANKRKGKWTEDEIINLKDAVGTYGGKNWAAIAALVPGRTKNQCCSRWSVYCLSLVDL